MASEFTIEDLQAWLKCDRLAGRRVWFDSDFYIAMIRKSTGEANDYFMERGIFSSIRRREGLPDPEVGAYAPASKVEEEAYSLLLNLAVDLKDRFQKNEIRGFEHLGQFINYINEILSGRLIEKMWGGHHTVPIGTSQSNGDALNPVDMADPRSAEAMERFFQKEDLSKWNHQADQLQKVFMESKIKTSETKRRIELLREVAGNLGPLGVILFTERGFFHSYFHKKAIEKLGSDFNQSVWNSYNRRLKEKWNLFLESKKGKELNEQFKECREWLKQIIRAR
jgi:hypothetical protein